jgi:heptosyltransferase-2/heptosyltransferase-3
LYGPISTAKFGPWGDPARHAAVKTRWPCAPCNRLDWPDDILAQHACITAITPEDVVNAAARILRGA